MITVRDLVMRLPSGGQSLTILDGVSLEVAAGEVVAVTGPSGSGKSTLLGLLAGLDTPSAGSITVDGVEVTRLGEADLARFRRRTIGFVFQSFHLIPTLTALENVAVPLELARVPPSRCRPRGACSTRSASRAGADHYPAQLSGGEQQRVAIARAVALAPPAAAGRRADGQPRLGHRRPDHRRAARAQPPARHDARPRHPRCRAGRARRPRHRAARRPSWSTATSRDDGAVLAAPPGLATGARWRPPPRGGRAPASPSALARWSRSARSRAGLEATLAREAKSLLGGDVELRAARPLPLGGRGRARASRGGRAACARARAGRHGPRSRARREPAGRAEGGERGLSALRPPRPRCPARRWRRCWPTTARVVQRQVLDRLGLAVGDRLSVGDGHAHDPRRGRGRARPLGGARQSRSARVPVARRRSSVRAWWASAAACATACWSACPPSPAPRRARDAGARDRQPGRARGRLRRGPAGAAALLRSAHDVPGAGGAGESARRRHRRGRGDGGVRGAPDADPRGLESPRRRHADARRDLRAADAGRGARREPGRRGPRSGASSRCWPPRSPAWCRSRSSRGPQVWTLVRAIAMGLGTTLLCTWAPLAAVRSVPPWLVLRRDVAPAAARSRPRAHAPAGRRGPLGARALAGRLAQDRRDLRRGPRSPRCSRCGRWPAWSSPRAAAAARPRSGLAPRGGGPGPTRQPRAPRRRGARHRGDAAGDRRAAAGRAGPADRSRAPPGARRRSSSSTSSRISASRSRASCGQAAGTPPMLTPVVRARLSALDGERLTRDVVARRARGDSETRAAAGTSRASTC